MIETGPGWEMRLGDCIEGMRTLADDSVDVVITDPPYDTHTHKAGRAGASILNKPGARESRRAADGAAISRVRDLGFDALTTPQMAASACEFARLARRWTLIFCSVEMISDWRAALTAAGLDYVRTCFWHKLGATPQFTGDRPAQAVEAIVVAHRPGRKHWHGGGKHGWYDHEDLPQLVYHRPIVLERGHGEVRMHTTQKPISLMRDLVHDFSDYGQLTLDAFAGSASTAIACRLENRLFLGFEMNRDYFDIACRRLRGEEAKPNPAQPSLFDAMA